MADRLFFPFLSGLAAADLAATQAGVVPFGGVPQVAIVTPGHAYVSVMLPYQAEVRIPAVAPPAVPFVPQGSVVYSSTTVARPSMTDAPQRLRSMIVSQGPFAPGTQPHFEVGSSSTAASPILYSRAQRRNYRRRMARRARRGFEAAEARQRTVAEQLPSERPTVATDVEDTERSVALDERPIPSFSHLCSGSRYHLLSAAPGEESATRIARASTRSLSSVIVRSPDHVQRESRRERHLRFQRLADQSGDTFEGYLRSAKTVVADRARAEFLRGDPSRASSSVRTSPETGAAPARRPTAPDAASRHSRASKGPRRPSEAVVIRDLDRSRDLPPR